jgi:arylsulfatase A-like enzyme
MSSCDKPNIVVVFTDQQRWDTLGVNGCPLGLTPNLDRLARRGTFFPEATTPQPVCGPARSCLQTGQYATVAGVWRNGLGMRASAPKLAECFRAGGYRTGYIGKWHLSEGTGPAAVPSANRGGYEDWLGANAVEMSSGPYSPVLWDGEDRAVRMAGYRTDAFTDAAIDYVCGRARTPERPFLLYLSFLEPHHQNTDDSYPAPHGMENLFDGAWMPADLRALGGSAPWHWAGYCAMIKRIDDGLGRLVDAVGSLGLAENTIFAFVSDHGCHFKTRNPEYKRTPHESSVRVPMVLWGPQWDGGGEHRIAASLVDLAPSLLESAGLPVPAAMQGHSLLPVTRGETGGIPREAFIQFGEIRPGRALRTSRWKYAVFAGEDVENKPEAGEYFETELYDLRADPSELTNVIASPAHAPVREYFRARLLERMAAIGEPPTIIRPFSPEDPPSQRSIEYPACAAWQPGM